MCSCFPQQVTTVPDTKLLEYTEEVNIGYGTWFSATFLELNRTHCRRKTGVFQHSNSA
ncbi:hypothetical protein EXN66_Car010303 [Channa argus]|uniref:Uncharacterized protein n=1 Tax=Channa argus TaxID=215402 RepID=A0A6G1PWL0_CHAAH|nr:hypothetical protein EXN66_Car010303 [Channa argus]